MRLQFRLLLETIALTVLIWTYADQASYEDCDSVLAVKIETTSPDLLARIEGAHADVLYIPIKLRGPKAAVRKLQLDKSAGTAVAFNLTVTVSDDLQAPSPHTQDIRDEVSHMTAFRDRGLQLTQLTPSVITYTLDHYTNVKLALDTDAGRFSEALDGKPTVEPKQVTARVLESELKKRGNLEPRLVVPIEDRLRARADESGSSFMVPLGTKWEGMDATFKPDQVRVTIQLARHFEKAHLTLIPLRVVMPPDVAGGDYRIEWQNDADLVQDIDVRLPVGKRALANTDVRALVEIEKSDLPGELSPATATAPAPSEGWTQREIHFFFGPGFEDVQVNGPPRMVKFRIKKKPASGDLPSPDPQ